MCLATCKSPRKEKWAETLLFPLTSPQMQTGTGMVETSRSTKQKIRAQCALYVAAVFRAALQAAQTHSGDLVCISLPACVQWDLEFAMLVVFTPWGQANAADQVHIPPPRTSCYILTHMTALTLCRGAKERWRLNGETDFKISFSSLGILVQLKNKKDFYKFYLCACTFT